MIFNSHPMNIKKYSWNYPNHLLLIWKNRTFFFNFCCRFLVPFFFFFCNENEEKIHSIDCLNMKTLAGLFWKRSMVGMAIISNKIWWRLVLFNLACVCCLTSDGVNLLILIFYLKWNCVHNCRLNNQ